MGKIGINKKAGVLIYLSIGVSIYLSAIAHTHWFWIVFVKMDVESFLANKT
jgi:hypothetical protein